MRRLIDKFQLNTRKVTLDTAAVPVGVRAYIIGDIHGMVDLLRSLHARIRDDASSLPADTRKFLIYIGDYVDRGYESRAVVDLALQADFSGFEKTFLKGNHEEMLLKFLEDPAAGPAWLSIGGDATLLSYGVSVLPDSPVQDRFLEIQRQAMEGIPAEHRAFFDNLKLSFELGDYLFVHAGIVPGVALERQSPEDLLWIREEFLASKKSHGKIIVHGHSPTPEPQVKPNRIGIDTGAYYTKRLTCLVLEGQTFRFLDSG